MSISFQLLQPLSIQVPAETGEWYPSRVLDLLEGRRLMVAVPLREGREISIAPDTRVTLELTLPTGLRRYLAVVQARGTSATPALWLSWPEDEERIQRRESVRVRATIPVDVYPSGEGTAPAVRGTTIDLSASGAQLVLPHPPPQSALSLVLHLPGVGERRCGARVVSREEDARGAAGERHRLAVEFTGLSEALRRDITRVVFELEREQRNRRMV